MNRGHPVEAERNPSSINTDQNNRRRSSNSVRSVVGGSKTKDFENEYEGPELSISCRNVDLMKRARMARTPDKRVTDAEDMYE